MKIELDANHGHPNALKVSLGGLTFALNFAGSVTTVLLLCPNCPNTSFAFVNEVCVCGERVLAVKHGNRLVQYESHDKIEKLVVRWLATNNAPEETVVEIRELFKIADGVREKDLSSLRNVFVPGASNEEILRQFDLR